MFDVEILEGTEEVEQSSYRFFDEENEAIITFDFSEMDNNPKCLDYHVNLSIIKRSKKLTKFQFKKKVKRTATAIVLLAVNHAKSLLEERNQNV